MSWDMDWVENFGSTGPGPGGKGKGNKSAPVKTPKPKATPVKGKSGGKKGK
jgi:hypothetical protein